MPIGESLYVWGGDTGSSKIGSGAIYNFSSGAWTSMASTSAPAARAGFSMVANGTQIIVWGGVGDSSLLNSGGIYETRDHTWSSLSTDAAGGATVQATAFHSTSWSGSKMIIWGGVTSSDGSVATDSMVSEANIYDTTAGSWSVRQYQNGRFSPEEVTRRLDRRN